MQAAEVQKGHISDARCLGLTLSGHGSSFSSGALVMASAYGGTACSQPHHLLGNASRLAEGMLTQTLGAQKPRNSPLASRDFPGTDTAPRKQCDICVVRLNVGTCSFDLCP